MRITEILVSFNYPATPGANFHKSGVERKAKRYYQKLLEYPPDVAKQDYEIEIIPYEDLWEIVLETLNRKTYKLDSITPKGN